MKKGRKREWAVYILRCGDGSLYTGIAKDVAARVERHRRGKGAAYTRTHLPVRLVYQEPRRTRSSALIREAQIKRMSRSSKKKMICGRYAGIDKIQN
ncbi:MAG: hypothetical protein A3G34_17020 [Candidatus Lindowbacteria bacterium RIFCSPLOWO2_12_FULL_62_27]|nr:MAG: hypothetical protein A3G34_17020 [Candidatus Lindowbacteria bacterium RIFCSPLOWO2_12_FULL_62_27]